MSELENFINFTEEHPTKEKVLLVDTNNMSMRCLYALAYDPTDTQFTSYKNAFLGSLSYSAKRFSNASRSFWLDTRRMTSSVNFPSTFLYSAS